LKQNRSFQVGEGRGCDQTEFEEQTRSQHTREAQLTWNGERANKQKNATLPATAICVHLYPSVAKRVFTGVLKDVIIPSIQKKISKPLRSRGRLHALHATTSQLVVFCALFSSSDPVSPSVSTRQGDTSALANVFL
jgi:hypothetical protein